MIKTFCDNEGCGEELLEYDKNVEFLINNKEWYLMSFHRTEEWHEPSKHICKACLIKALREE